MATVKDLRVRVLAEELDLVTLILILLDGSLAEFEVIRVQQSVKSWFRRRDRPQVCPSLQFPTGERVLHQTQDT